MADFDNDSDLDLITVVFEGVNVLHRNVGAPGYFDAGFALVDPFSSPVGLSRGLDFADLNNDGSLDVVIANRTLLELALSQQRSMRVGQLPRGTQWPIRQLRSYDRVAKFQRGRTTWRRAY